MVLDEFDKLGDSLKMSYSSYGWGWFNNDLADGRVRFFLSIVTYVIIVVLLSCFVLLLLFSAADEIIIDVAGPLTLTTLV